MGFQLRNCEDIEQVIITDTSLVDYVGQIVLLEEYADICWEVLAEVEDTGAVVTVTDCFQSCDDCTRMAYQLTDCTGRLLPRYSVQDDLAAHIGAIIKVPYYDNSCFTITEVRYYSFERETEHIEYSNIYDTCAECRQRKTVEPDYTVVNCDTEYTDKVKSRSSETIYNQVISKRYGVKPCCQEDAMKWEIRNEMLKIDLLRHPSPDLPEPIVEACCIVTTVPCTGCRVCPTEGEEVVCPCKCSASAVSPHDCHTYTFNVVAEMLADATGNTDTNLNGKNYFGYIPCGKTDAVTVALEEASSEEFCVLGIPILGWYKDNEWVNYDSIPEGNLTRGAVCEAPEETECTPCNTCN